MNNLKQLVGGLIFTGFMPNIFGWFWAVLFKWRENHRVEYTMMRSGGSSCLLLYPLPISSKRSLQGCALMAY